MDLTNQENDQVGATKASSERKHTPLRYTYLYWKWRFDGGVRGIQTQRAPFACIAIYQPTPLSDVFVGVSRCSLNDQFVRKRARNIAAGRARKAEACLRQTQPVVGIGVVLPWAQRYRISGSATMELAEAIKKARAQPMPYYAAGVNVLFDFCHEAGIPVVDHGGNK